MKRLFGMIVTACSIGSVSYAKPPSLPADQCQRYVGQIVVPRSFADLVATLPSAPVRKDQFETTAAFKARAAQASAPSTTPLVVRQDANRRLLMYDADKQRLNVSVYAFGGDMAGIERVVRPADRYLKPTELHSDLAFPVIKTEIGKRTYEATNGLGAKVQVEEITTEVGAIWDHTIGLGEFPFVHLATRNRLAEIPLDAVAARDVVENSVNALVVVPRAPFVVKGASTTPPTFSQPLALVENLMVVTADIQCALILDRSGRTLYAFDVK